MSEATHIPPDLADWLAIRDEHIARLEQEQQSLLNQMGTLSQEQQTLKQEHVAYVTAYQHRTQQLQQEIQRWQEDYEALRLQKGGFGFKAILASGILATVVGLLLGWLLFRPVSPNSSTFAAFRRQAGFPLEYALSQHQYKEAGKIVQDQIQQTSNTGIKAELEFIADLVRAAGQNDTNNVQAGNFNGFTYTSPKDTAVVSDGPKSKLVVTHEAGANLHAEAMTNSLVLGKLKKKDEVGRWDRTAEMTKVRTTHKGEKGMAEDYWYEVETTEGTKGWVYGFFTNASLKRFKFDVPDSLRIKKDSVLVPVVPGNQL
jgi:hypothetical protein